MQVLFTDLGFSLKTGTKNQISLLMKGKISSVLVWKEPRILSELSSYTNVTLAACVRS